MKNTIPLIALSAFMVLILLGFDFMVKPAYALIITDVALNADISGNMVYASGLDKFVGISGGVNSQIQTVDVITQTATTTTITGVNSVGLGCDGTSCFTGAGTSNLYRFNPITGAITASTTVSMTTGETSVLSSLTFGSTTALVQSGVLYVPAICDAGGIVYAKFDTSLTFIGYIGDCAGTKLGNGSGSDTPLGQKISGSRIAIATSNGATSTFQIWNTGGGRVCTIIVGDIYGSNGGNIARVGSTWLLATTSTERVDIMSDTCTDTGDITQAQYGGTTDIHYIEADTSRGEVYIQTTTTVFVMNSSALTTRLYSFQCASDTARTSAKYDSEHEIYGCTSSNSFRLVELGESVAEPEPDGQTGGTCLNVDTNGDGKSGTVLDCVGESTSPFAGITGGQNATDITATLTDGIGLTNCGTENPDHETCGSGLFLFLILLLLSEFLALAGYLGFTRITNAEAHIMDVGLLVLIIGFVDLSIAFYLNWIPDIVFYSIVTIIAGFLAFGLFSRLRGA